MIFILQNIRSAWNVGSIFRTADAVGGSVVCLGYTARPVEPALKLIKKTAIGAEQTVQWHSCESVDDVLRLFPKNKGYNHYAAEINETSESLLDHLATLPALDLGKVCIWLGNEIGGLDSVAISHCDYVTHLPMIGMKESLNVANTATTFGYLFLQRDVILKNPS